MEKELFDETTLKNIISSAVLMSSIDGEIHQKEWEIILSFVDQHWQDDYQDFKSHQQNIERDIGMIFQEKEKFQQKLNDLVEQLTTNLNSRQKNIVLNLVGEVMIADGIMTLEESKLFATFMDKLDIRLY